MPLGVIFMGLEKINIYKKQLGLTNEELAHKSGVPKSTIDKITAGVTYDPKLETVKAIVRALGKRLSDLDDMEPEIKMLATVTGDERKVLFSSLFDSLPQSRQDDI